MLATASRNGTAGHSAVLWRPTLWAKWIGQTGQSQSGQSQSTWLIPDQGRSGAAVGLLLRCDISPTSRTQAAERPMQGVVDAIGMENSRRLFGRRRNCFLQFRMNISVGT
ncbi:hypothetical protein RJ55_01090 [Drechmeria coniospora]|nr:hypothetical protein RJ55_01090 [Drechmeria coniospora]